ncbi:hypothetical protein O181_028701 [Austropuccinia psidii MF-1]|uniref:Uncharacterized protein n=1 Tax=Austropuccinia psidii MF-1 TaxID=1389203 RepID=A0A9Q3CPP1_9BASI|nr:hypothetical protein [Austropuccinia psidii MF-1]
MAMARGHSSLGQLSPMGFKCQSKFSFSSLTHFSSRNHTDCFPLRIEKNQPNPLQQDSPVPSLPCEQTLQKPTPGPSGTQWLEDLFRETSQLDEPPIPGPSPSSEPHEDVLTREPEPEVAPTQSMEEPFACPTPPPAIIIIDNTPVGSLPAIAPKNPTVSSPHSHNEALQEFTDLQSTLMIPQAIDHGSINQILVEHCQLLHMIPFMDATHQKEMHREFWEELNSLLGQALEAYPKEDITG